MQNLTPRPRCVRAPRIRPVWLALTVLAGCARPPQAPAPTGPVAADPADALRQAIAWRTEGRYRELTAVLDAPHPDAFARVLVAVDGFLAENRKLCDWLRDQAGVGLSQTVDQAYIADDLTLYAGPDFGPFSRRVEVLDAALTGEGAEVAYLIGDVLPARRAHLRRAPNGWRLCCTAPASDQVAAAFSDMADGLRTLHGDLAAGRIPAADLRAAPDLLLEKVKTRLRRGVGLLSKARDGRATVAAESGSPPR